MKAIKRIFFKIYHIFIGICILTFCLILYIFLHPIFFNKNIWIISERPNEARDNGYTLFKYIRENYPELKCYYAINKNCGDFNIVNKYGNVINFGSLQHFILYAKSRVLISSTTQYFCPSYYLIMVRKLFHLPHKYVFLQHGITKDDLPFLYAKKAKIDYFICGAQKEYEWIRDKFGYGDKAYLTGFARFDNYFEVDNENNILIMPTWRRGVDFNNLTESNYYNQWQSLLNNNEFDEILQKYNLKAKFYVHPLYQQYSDKFTCKSNNIAIATIKNCNLQDLIKKSKMLITDFSSVYFDFGYMRKPVIYYQFDEDTFFENHYSKGYFDCRNNGFGPVVKDLNDFVYNFDKICKTGFIPSKNCEIFFLPKDKDNCKRIYELISKI